MVSWYLFSFNIYSVNLQTAVASVSLPALWKPQVFALGIASYAPAEQVLSFFLLSSVDEELADG